jgi:hypothetical protein
MMQSVWVCADALPSKKLNNSHRGKAGRSYLGVFVDDPANIGRWLPRPPTPFVPAPEVQVMGKDVDSVTHSLDSVSGSPSADGPLDFGRPRLEELQIGIAVF